MPPFSSPNSSPPPPSYPLIPSLINIIYDEHYLITENEQTIGTFYLSGGTGEYSNTVPTTINVEIDLNFPLQDGDTFTLFTIPEGENVQWEDVTLTGIGCLKGEGEIIADEESGGSKFQVFVNPDSYTCTTVTGVLKFSTISLLTGSGL